MRWGLFLLSGPGCADCTHGLQFSTLELRIMTSMATQGPPEKPPKNDPQTNPYAIFFRLHILHSGYTPENKPG